MPRQTPNPQQPPRPPKSKEERVSEKVEAKLVEQETAARMQAMIAQQRAEQAAAERSGRIGKRPFEQMLQAAGAEVQAKQESQVARVDSLLHAAGVELDARIPGSPEAAAADARQRTLEVARLAASMIEEHGGQTGNAIQPNTVVVSRIGSATVKKVATKVPGWRLATGRTRSQKRNGVDFSESMGIKDGTYTGRPVERTKLFGKETEQFHMSVAEGWEIPIARGNLPGGAKLILTPDGRIASFHAQKRNLRDLSFIESDPTPSRLPEAQGLLAGHLSYLDQTLESDIAGYNLQITDPVSRAEIALGRENDIQQGLAMLVAQLGVAPQQG